MADLIQISLEETGNLLSSKSLLKDNPTISYIGNTGKTYGAEFFVNPNVAITISNRYLQVTRTHKGI